MTGVIFLVTLPLLLVVYIMFSRSTLGKVIEDKLSEHLTVSKNDHIKGNRLRKEFTRKIQEILQELARESNANRAIIFEFSNGTNNLVGLPFMFMTASAEVATPGLPLMSQRHQRLNTSIVADFLTRLEKDESIYVCNTSPILEEYKVLQQIMKNADLSEALFHSIQGMDEVIGFLVLITTKTSGNKLDLTNSLLLMSKASQKISSMINFDEIEKQEKEKKGK